MGGWVGSGVGVAAGPQADSRNVIIRTNGVPRVRVFILDAFLLFMVISF
jgi:hypothetical protein